ncbi:MAG TPA: NAD(P)-dependent oxidoreductase [Sneathiellales bacterium]|nr:NAD(P)-dependent oxidoreductase [Sneathiellales bacterium]
MTLIPYETIPEKLTGERVMLVGGAGFIGHNFALELRNVGADVMVVDNLMVNSLVDNVYDGERPDRQRTVYLDFLLDRFELMREAGVELRNADARLLTDLNCLFDEFNPTKVVHMSAIASAVEARKNPGLCFDLQLITLRNVLELCRTGHENINQVMLMSSSTVYGDFEGASVDESTRPRPRGIYANAKFMAERLLRTYNHQHGLGTTIIRPSALYGERCISRRVSQVFIENALNGKPLLLEGGGDGRLDFTYIKDLINGMVRALALHEGGNSSQTFNLTFGQARTIADLAAVVKSVVPEANLEERPRAEDKPIRGTLSTKRAEEMLGFKAEWNLDEGYKKYCEWYAAEWERAGHLRN